MIIPLARKDKWNASNPSGDQQFITYYREPARADRECRLRPVVDARTTDRADLVAILLTGLKLPGLTPFTYTR